VKSRSQHRTLLNAADSGRSPGTKESEASMKASPRRLSATALAAAASALLIAACGSSENKEKEKVASTGESSKPTLLVYSAQGYSPNGVKAFEEETGTPAKLVENSTGPLFARIQAEKADPQWGLFWVDGQEPFASLDEQGMLVKNLEIPKLTALGEKLLPADHSFVPTGLTLACAIIYNSTEVTSPPTSWEQLTESKYAGKIGMNNPSVSGPTYPCIVGVMKYLGGEAKGKEFFEKLKENGLKISETNGDTLHLLETGQISIGMIQSSAEIGAAEKVHGLKVTYLPDETILPSNIGVDANAPKAVREEAQEFIDWVLSPPGQHQMKIGDPEGDSLYWPVAANTKPRPEMPELSSISTQQVDPYEWGKKEASINKWFTTNIVE
jgi:iron(III) transport system substrate-binding protein